MKDQFGRLAKTQTISSVARRIATKIPKSLSSPDSLDLALASTYDHHAVWGAGRAFVVKQEHGCIADHAREQQKESTNDRRSGKELLMMKHESKSAYRNDNYHVQLGIPPYHGSNSRRGYGRGPDGSFYST